MRIVIACLLSCLAVPAFAQDGFRGGATGDIDGSTGTHLRHDITAKDIPAARLAVANCIALARPRQMASWLATLPGSAEDKQIVKKMNLDSCYGSRLLNVDGTELTINATYFRNLVATSMVNRAFAKLPASPAPIGETRWFDSKLAALPDDAPVDRAALQLDDFAECVAEKKWTATLALVGSKAGSREEASAIADLADVLGPCSSSKTLRLDRPSLRALLGNAVYHMAVEPTLPTVAKAG